MTNAVFAQIGITGEGISAGIAAAVQFWLIFIPAAAMVAVIGVCWIASMFERRRFSLRELLAFALYWGVCLGLASLAGIL